VSKLISLNITTHDLNVQASTDTTTSKSDTKDLTGSLAITMYGGGASSASLGYGEQHATNESQTHHNTNLNANTINLNITNDATLKGATVRAENR
jgi:filamentous hemagglutinin